MMRELWIAARMFAALTVLTGAVYPALISAAAQWVFPAEAGGSLIFENGRPIGSTLIGQAFKDPKYFWPRPSATAPQPYNGLASAGSNLGPTNPALVEAVQQRLRALHEVDPNNTDPVPIELLSASASGLDPHISPAAARYQLRRVARLRGLTEDALSALIAQHTEARSLGVLGESRVNVLVLNLALDRIGPSTRPD